MGVNRYTGTLPSDNVWASRDGDIVRSEVVHRLASRKALVLVGTAFADQRENAISQRGLVSGWKRVNPR